ncbi:MAG: TetR/AcrR family transcriptional regulator [Chloroflexota bacterium]
MDRLTKEQWLDHGLHCLAKDGFTILKGDTLAKSLGVSRGSFYWHFKNLAEFHLSILARWETLTVETAVSTLEASTDNAAERLKAVINMAASSNIPLEQAIRAWANSNANVEQAVNNVDTSRIAYLEQIFTELGLGEEMAYARARIVYFGFLGQMLVGKSMTVEQRTLVTNELVHLTTKMTSTQNKNLS